MEDGEIAESLKCLLYQHEDLSLSLSKHVIKKKQKQKQQGTAAHTITLVLGRQRQEDPLSSLASQSGWFSELQVQYEIMPQKQQ